jgi:5'-nucleotidase
VHILLTNDDSHDSPLFLLAIEVMKELGEVSVVVPAREQSWKGKSMTRFETLYVDRIDLHGTAAFSVSGTPADCVNLAVWNLLDRRPDLVVSGINIGHNTGLGFFMASGTLGACFEANIAGIPAIALSQAMAYEDHRKWYAERAFNEASLARMGQNLRRVLPNVWRLCVEQGSGEPVTWNLNLPDHLEDETIVPTRIGHTFYGRCFTQRGDQFFHDLQPFETDLAPDTDQAIVRAGRVSATYIDLRTVGQTAAV